MNKGLLLGTLLMGTASLFTACSDDRDSNPTLIQPPEFKLNTPAYINETVNLQHTDELNLSWSQPQYTADNAPLAVNYELQVSPTNSFTTSTEQANADDSGNTVADYAAFTRTTTRCRYTLLSQDLNKTLLQIAKWSADAVPSTQKAYLRVVAYINENGARLHPVVSNTVELSTSPYYVELKDAEPIMWYLVGNNFGDGAWKDAPGSSCFPFFLQSGFAYDKATGGGEITYLNYFDTDGWKIQPADFNWDLGFMSSGNPNEAVFRNKGADNGNIWVSETGYYKVTLNTTALTCKIEQQDITPKVYDMICITGSFIENWADVNMTPVNKTGENHVWSYILSVPAGTTEQIKFKIPGSWDTNWGFGNADGEINKCGVGKNSGKNIGVPEGTWVIMFNDITGEFSIIPQK